MQALKDNRQKLYLTIGCTDTLNSAMMYDLYRSMLDEEEQIMNLKVKTHYSSEIYQYLENHDIDLGFVHHHLHFKNTVANPILEEKMYIIQSENAAVQREYIHTDELDLSREIFLSWEADYQIWHDQWVTKGVRPRFQVDTFELLFHLLSKENMWAIAPITVAERIQKLRPVMVSEIANKTKPPKRITYMIKHKYPNEATLRSVQVFEERLESYLREKDWGYLG